MVDTTRLHQPEAARTLCGFHKISTIFTNVTTLQQPEDLHIKINMDLLEENVAEFHVSNHFITGTRTPALRGKRFEEAWETLFGIGRIFLAVNERQNKRQWLSLQGVSQHPKVLTNTLEQWKTRIPAYMLKKVMLGIENLEVEQNAVIIECWMVCC